MRRVRERLCPKKVVEEEDPVLELAKQRQAELEEKEEDVEVKEYDPEQPIDPEPPLTGLARFNPVKRVQRRRRMKKMEKKSKPSKVESGSVLQKKLTKLALYIGYAGTAAAVLCVLVLVLKFSITKFGINGEPWDSSTDFSELLPLCHYWHHGARCCCARGVAPGRYHCPSLFCQEDVEGQQFGSLSSCL